MPRMAMVESMCHQPDGNLHKMRISPRTRLRFGDAGCVDSLIGRCATRWRRRIMIWMKRADRVRKTAYACL